MLRPRRRAHNPPSPWSGIWEKLKRADENIQNLNTEISTFLNEGPDGGVGQSKPKNAKEWFKTHSDVGVPLRFGVICGEIVYHLRSSMDHVAWVLSSRSYRETDGRWIAFPVFTELPEKGAKTSYDRQVAGITSPLALGLIERFQPYKVSNPADHPLAIVHHLSNADKHRTLALVVATFDFSIQVPGTLVSTRMIGGGLKKDDYAMLSQHAPQAKIHVAKQIAFAEFGQRKYQTVVPALKQLADFTRDAVRQFSELII